MNEPPADEDDGPVVNWQPGWETDDTAEDTWHDTPPPTGAENWERWE